MGLLTFPLGVIAVFAILGAYEVFLLGRIEHAWGVWPSFQVIMWVGIGAGLFAAIPFGVVCSILKRYPSGLRAFLLGAGSSTLALLVAAWLFPPKSSAASLVMLFFALAALTPLLAPRTRSHNGAPVDDS